MTPMVMLGGGPEPRRLRFAVDLPCHLLLVSCSSRAFLQPTYFVRMHSAPSTTQGREGGGRGMKNSSCLLRPSPRRAPPVGCLQLLGQYRVPCVGNGSSVNEFRILLPALHACCPSVHRALIAFFLFSPISCSPLLLRCTLPLRLALNLLPPRHHRKPEHEAQRLPRHDRASIRRIHRLRQTGDGLSYRCCAPTDDGVPHALPAA